MTPLQLKLIHLAKRQLRLEDADYRTILRSIGQVESSKDLSNESFERVMAYFEERGFSNGADAHYWRKRTSPERASTRAIHHVQELCIQTNYQLPGLVRRHSHGRTEDPAELTPQEAYELTEALKAILDRKRQALTQPSLFSAETSTKPHEAAPRQTEHQTAYGDTEVMDDPDVPF